MIDHWYALNVLYHMHYNYTCVLWNIQRRLQHIQNINFATQIDEFAQLVTALLFVKCICSWPSWKMAAIFDFRLDNLT